MNEHQLLIRHTRAWADGKSRELHEDVLTEILELRDRYDDLPYGEWPAGSAERLLLDTWPAYGANPPDPASLEETMDTFWRFLRATGRMSARSATPAALRKELKRALPKMTAAYDDPSRHSQGRVIQEFGESVGISLEDVDSEEELQKRLNQLTEAWNSLPQEERVSRMPDPSPKGTVAAGFSSMAHESDDEIPELEPGDVHVSGNDARESGFVRDCLRLAAWAGEGREVTARGLLRPAVAREAYQHLGLWEWEREHDKLGLVRHRADPRRDDPEVDAVLARAALNS